MKSPILGGSYVARSTNASDSRLVNLYSEATAESGKETGFLSRCPGLRLLDTVGSGPIRGLWTFGEYAYVVSGTELYRMSANYNSSLLGAVTGTGPVSMTDNGTQLFVACNGPGFIYSSSTGVFGAISDPDFAGAVSVGFIDGYFVFTQPNSQVFWVTTLYGSGIDPLDFASAEGSPDGLVSMIVDHREVWLFGTNTVEVWYNAGDTNFPLARIQGAFNEIGCVAPYSVAKLDNGVFWLGADARGNGIVYRSRGYTGLRVSTNAIEFAIQNYAVISDAVAYTYQQEGHLFYVLTFPSANATWVYDASTDLWHERAGWGPNGFMRHRSNCQVNFNNEIIVGDYENSNIYALDLNEYTDNGEPQKWLRSWRAIPPGQNDLKRTAQHSLQLDMEVGAFNTLTKQVPTDETAELDITLAGIVVSMSALYEGDILFAPFNSTTTTTDVISPPLVPVVTTPVNTTLTFDATKGTYNTLANPGAAPSAVYGPFALSKISPANYPTDSLFISAYINLTGVNNGVSAATTVSEFLKFIYSGNASNTNELTFGVYVELSTLYIRTRAYCIANNSNVYRLAPGPSSGVHFYSIEWTPSGGAIFRLDNQIVRYSEGATRPTTDYPAKLYVTGPLYGGASPGGIYGSTISDVLFSRRDFAATYSFTTIYDNLTYTNNGRTISMAVTALTPFASMGSMTSIDLSGKVYCEFEITAVASIVGMVNGFGVIKQDPDLVFNMTQNTGAFIYSRQDVSIGCGFAGNSGMFVQAVEAASAAYKFYSGDRIGLAFDTATKKLWISRNGVYISGDPVAGTSPSATLTVTGPFRFAAANYSCSAPNGTYSYGMYPNLATMLYSPPSGFSRYDPS